MVVNWRCNIIRLPFNQDWALHGNSSHSAEDYLASMDQVISWGASLGAYTILDLQWLDAETVYGQIKQKDGKPSDNHVPPTPNSESILLWRALAKRYRDETAVLFDILNEPHDPLGDDVLPLHEIGSAGDVIETNHDSVGPKEWVCWAERLVAEIRAVRPTGIVMVAGVDWAFDLRGVRIQAPNIVYSAHIYSNRRRDDWRNAIGDSSNVPVFVGEWGGTEEDLDFGRALVGEMRRLGLGWTAWSWVDEPKLVKPPRVPHYEPTVFGELVRNELLRIGGPDASIRLG
jgi:hypothetical protein